MNQKRKKRWKRIDLIVAVVIVVSYFFSKYQDFSLTTILSPIQQTISISSEIELEPVTLKRVVDGDTIIILDQNQNEIRVRMIGIDTPESVHPDQSKNTLDGDIASVYTQSQLKAGQTVYLEYDKERLDQYGRTLAYVWLASNVDPTDLNDIQAKMYNAKLLVEGYAVAKSYPPNTKYETIFKSLEQK